MWPDEIDRFIIVCNKSHPGKNALGSDRDNVLQIITHNIPISWVVSKTYFGWLPHSIARITQPIFRIFLFPYQLCSLCRIFTKTYADALLVFNGGYPAGETCRLANIAWKLVVKSGTPLRNIHSFHNFAVPPRAGFALYENFVDLLFSKSVSSIVSVSKACAVSLSVRKVFKNNGNVKVIYNGVKDLSPVDESTFPNLRKTLGINDSPMCLLLANYEKRKGHHFLIRAFSEVSKRIPDAHLVCCGAGEQHEILEVKQHCKIQAPNSKIHFLEFIPNGSQLISQSDVVVISSQCFESFGLTAAEAMLQGIPVVATNVGGLPEVFGIPPTGGFLVEPDDVNGFADRIIKLLLDPTLRMQIGAAGKLRASVRFTAERMARDYYELLKGVDSSDFICSRSEYYYLFLHCRNLDVAAQSIHLLFKSFIRRLVNRLVDRRIFLYPISIRRLSVLLPNGTVPKLNTVTYVLSVGPRRLKLAIGWHVFKEWPNWNSNFDDHEQYVSMHRWNWLLRALTDESPQPSIEWGFDLVRSWVNAMGCYPSGEAGESYTVGERISNLCLFTRHATGSWKSLPLDLTDIVRFIGLRLAQRVEYHPGELSGNHVINNARALLFAGHCTKTPQLVTLARAILLERLPKIVKSGFLREGSSHYQFLFTRWLLEMAMLARECNDIETTQLIEPFLQHLVFACDFFKVESKDCRYFLTTMGDVSPDAEPSWLSGLSSSALLGNRDGGQQKGWATLYPDANILFNARSLKPQGWIAFPDAGWYRLDFSGWVALWHAEGSEGDAIASHAHHDFCAFVLYRNGQEVLIDPGRFDYGGSALGSYGIGADSHNSVTLNGRAPMLSRGDRLLPAAYREANFSITHEEHNNECIVNILHNGFSRLGQNVLHQRSFIFREDEILIQDKFEGVGTYRMEARFHQPTSFGAGLISNCEGYQSCPPWGIVEQIDSKQSELLQEDCLVESEVPLGGWRFPAYGICEPAMTQRFLGNIRLPASIKYRLTGNRI